MIQRETYLRRIRPFIGQDVIKVMTGIRRSGKSVMLELIRQEDHSRPLSDQKLAELLAEQGIRIARRTVAKYRTELRLGSAAVRKRD